MSKLKNSLPRPEKARPTLRRHPMRIRDILADLLGVICIFGIGYTMLFLGYVISP